MASDRKEREGVEMGKGTDARQGADMRQGTDVGQGADAGQGTDVRQGADMRQETDMGQRTGMVQQQRMTVSAKGRRGCAGMKMGAFLRGCERNVGISAAGFGRSVGNDRLGGWKL